MLEILVFLVVVGTVLVFGFVLRSRNLHIWIWQYLRQQLRPGSDTVQHRHYYFCLADHHEPYLGNVGSEIAHARVKRWIANYPAVARQHTDSDDRHPQHSYFYPEEEYDEWVIDQIKSLCDQDLGDAFE